MAKTTTKAKKSSSKKVTRQSSPSAKATKKQPASRKARSKNAVCRLPGKLTITGISGLIDNLTCSLKAKETVKVDINDVEQVDTAALQVLIGFCNSAKKADCDIEWQGNSELLHKYIKTLALDPHLNVITTKTSDDDLCPVF